MGEEVELPPQIREQLVRLQQLQQTLQAVVTQKQQLEIELTETDNALSELKKIKEKTLVYKSVGNILIKSNKQSILDELEEKNELLNTRVTVLGKQEARTKERIQEIQGKLQERMGGRT
jgi:prefoldin beta subunit